ncbi:MAG: dipeptidyl-peptidase 3 family protein, partial [Myxococcaceae bacterium]
MILSLLTVTWLSAVPPLPTEAQLKTLSARFKPVDITADVKSLPVNEKAALAKILQAAQLMDTLYVRQSSPGNETLLLQLLQDDSGLGRERLKAFILHKGPWSQQDGYAPFLPGVGERSKSGNFYPTDSTKSEIEAWIAKLPAAERTKAMGFFTTIRRTPDNKLTIVPYSMEYQGELGL